MLRKQHFAPVAFATLCGCVWSPSDTKEINTSLDSVDASTQLISSAVKSELAAKPYTRRVEAIQYWITNGDDDQNITSNSPDASFIRFVCAGHGALQTQALGLSYVNSFISGLRATVSPGKDSLAGQFARFRTLSDPVPVLALPNAPSETPRSRCQEDVLRILEFVKRGFPLADTTDEIALTGALAIFESGRALVSAVGSLATEALRVSSDVMARRQAVQFLDENRENLDIVVTENLSPDKLNNAWERRMALALPYQEFGAWVGAHPGGAPAESAFEQGSRIASELDTFDKMVVQPRPGDLVVSVQRALSHLEESLRDENVSLAAIAEYAQYFEGFAKKMKSEYDEINKQWDNLQMGRRRR